METTAKIIIGVIAILLVGLSAVFITANSNQESTSNTESQFKVSDVTPSENTIVAPPENEEDDSNEEEDVPITGTPLERASAAALAHIGEGRVTDSEIGDEEGYYEIEITLDNGDEVDVHLDENFNILSTEYESPEDKD